MANPYRDEETGKFTTKANWEDQQKWNKFNEQAINIIKEQNQLLGEQNNVRREARQLSKQILDDIREEETLGKDILRGEQDLGQKILDGQTRKKELIYEANAAAKAGDDESAKLLNERIQDQDNLNNKYEEELQERVRINEEMGVMDNLMKAMEDIPFLKQFVDGEEAIEAMEKSLQNGESAGAGLYKYAKDNAKEFGKLAGKAFLLQQALSVGPFLMKSMFEVSKQTSKFSKDLGVSASDALVLRTRMGLIAKDSDSMAVSTVDTSEAFHNLNTQFGTASTVLRSDIVGEMAKLSELTGLSAESQGRFASMAMRTGINAAEITKQTRAAVVEGEKERGVRLDINKVLDEAGQITGVIAANMGYNVTAIAKSIAVAKQFGMTLQDLAGISSNLLDFQSSIEAELQAELFTGKQLNLEKARLYALTGDYEGLTKEIMNNVGSETEFAQMNVLAKEKMATALGMSVDRMSDLVYQNANLAQLAQEARDRGEDELADSLEKRDVQQKMVDLQEKMADIAVTYLAPALDYIANIMSGLADNTGLMYTVLGAMAAIKLGGMIMSVVSLGTALAAAGVSSAALMSGITLGIGAAAIIAGIYAISSAASKAREQEAAAAKNINDGIIGPDGGLMVSGPKGSIQLNKDDSIIAGTDLGGGGGGQDSERMQRYQAESIALLKRISVATAASGVGSMIASISYSGFDAVKADTHYNTKFR